MPKQVPSGDIEKTPGSKWAIGLDYTDDLPDGLTIESVTVSFLPSHDGGLAEDGTPDVSDDKKKVSVKVKEGKKGVKYHVQFHVTDSEANLYEDPIDSLMVSVI